MDWPKARSILLVAFAAVNLVLSYVIWGPNGNVPGMTEAPEQQQVEQVRERLAERGLILAPSLVVPRTPEPMRFLHVTYVRPTPEYVQGVAELFQGTERSSLPVKAAIDKETQAVVYQLHSNGVAARETRLDNRRQLEAAADEFLRQVALLPPKATVAGIFPRTAQGTVTVEYVPVFDGYPVYSGYLRVEFSTRGVEAIRQYWVEPRGYTEAPPKAVRPAGEALLRLAGRLDNGATKRTVLDVRLGYYANRSLAALQSEGVLGWDTVPVWRILLDNGDVYYVNAFNGEWES